MKQNKTKITLEDKKYEILKVKYNQINMFRVRDILEICGKTTQNVSYYLQKSCLEPCEYKILKSSILPEIPRGSHVFATKEGVSKILLADKKMKKMHSAISKRLKKL